MVLNTNPMILCRLFFTVRSLAYKNTLEKQYFIVSEPKGEVISSKIDQLVAIYTSKFKWAWRGQFLSHTLQILEINQSLEAVKVSDIKKWK